MKEEVKNTSNLNQSNKDPFENEISIVAILKSFWNNWRIILTTIAVFLILGILSIILIPRKYDADITLMPQTDNAGGQTPDLLRQFGGITGLNVGSMSSSVGINPSLYPDITGSTPFYLHLLDKKINTKSYGDISLQTYFNEYYNRPISDYIYAYTIGLPTKIINLFRKKESFSGDTKSQNVSVSPQNILYLSSEERFAIGRLKDMIQTEIMDNGIVYVIATMPEPQMAAEVANFSVDYLKEYVKNYRTEKVIEDLEFIKERHVEAEENYKAAQRKLARFRDSHTNIITQKAKMEETRLIAEYNLTNNIYQDLSARLEEAKIRVQEETPIFKVLEPVKLPTTFTSPNIKMIIVLSLFAGIFVGIGIIFLKIFYAKMLENWHFQEELK